MIIHWLSLTTKAAAGMNSLMEYAMQIVASFHLSVLFTYDMYLIVASLVVRLLIILTEVEKNLMQICWTEVLSWYWRFKHITATKDGFWSYEYWSRTLILTRFTHLMDQLKELGFCTLHAGVTLKCVGPSIGEKQPLTKKLPATITVSTCWYYIAILIYLAVVCILLGGFSCTEYIAVQWPWDMISWFLFELSLSNYWYFNLTAGN